MFSKRFCFLRGSGRGAGLQGGGGEGGREGQRREAQVSGNWPSCPAENLHSFLPSGVWEELVPFVLLKNNLILFTAILGLCCCMQASSSCSEWGLLFISVNELLIEMASLASEQGLQVHGLQWMHCTDSVVAAHRLSRAASVAVAHRLSCSSACGIFPDQGSNPYPPRWLVDSYTLYHQASPRWDYAQLFTSESCNHECYIIVSLECKDTLSRYNVCLHSSGKHLYVWTQSQIDFNGEVDINIKICLMWKYMRHKPRVNPNINHGLWMIIIHNCRFINVRNVLLWWECWEQRRLSLCGIYREYMKTSLHLLFSCFLLLNFARKT